MRTQQTTSTSIEDEEAGRISPLLLEQQNNVSSSSSTHVTVLRHQLEQCQVLPDDEQVPKKHTTRGNNTSAVLGATTRLYNDSRGEFKDLNHTRGSLYRQQQQQQQQQQPGQKLAQLQRQQPLTSDTNTI